MFWWRAIFGFIRINATTYMPPGLNFYSTQVLRV